MYSIASESTEAVSVCNKTRAWQSINQSIKVCFPELRKKLISKHLSFAKVYIQRWIHKPHTQVLPFRKVKPVVGVQ